MFAFAYRATTLCMNSVVTVYLTFSLISHCCSYDTGLKKPNRRIDKLNEILESKEFLVGTDFTVADIAISSYLLYVLQFFPDIDLSRWPNLVTYMETCVSRPAYGKAFGERIQQFLKQALADTGKPRGLFDIF